MDHDGGLALGMLLGGALMSLVPIGLSVALALYAFRERQRGVRERAAAAAAYSPEEGA